MTGRSGRKRAAGGGDAEFRWEPPEGLGRAADSDAPVLALLALTGALVVARADGAVEVVPVAAGAKALLGAPREVCRAEPPVSALVSCGGEVLAASGGRIVRITPDGRAADGPVLDARIGALCARAGRVFAVAGAEVCTLERDGGEWAVARRTPIPLEGCHDLDIDRRGLHAVVCARPSAGFVVALETGEVVGRVHPSEYGRKSATEICARFSPVTDHVYRWTSRAHRVDKLARLARSGRSLGFHHTLDQPSTWCTPVASGPDGRYVASRQSGVGVVVWDLKTEQQVLFAELDDADAEAKFARSARRVPTAVRALGDGIKITRWADLPGQDGDTTAVAVAPGARYAATGGRDGTITVIDAATRRIEHGDGSVRQPACVTADVEVGGAVLHAFGRAEWIGVAEDGTVTAVDLATGALRAPGAFDLAGAERPSLTADGDVLVLTTGRWAAGHDSASLAPVWRADDPLPDCLPPTYSGGCLLAAEAAGDGPRMVHLHDPRTGERRPLRTASCEDGGLAPTEVRRNRRTGDLFVLAMCGYPSENRWHVLPATGGPGRHLPARTTLLPGCERGLADTSGGWAVFAPADADEPETSVSGTGAVLGRVHLDPVRGLVAGHDLRSRRLHVWRQDGTPVAVYDGLGELWAASVAFTADSLWLHAPGAGRLVRVALPPA